MTERTNNCSIAEQLTGRTLDGPAAYLVGVDPDDSPAIAAQLAHALSWWAVDGLPIQPLLISSWCELLDAYQLTPQDAESLLADYPIQHAIASWGVERLAGISLAELTEVALR